MKSFAIVFTLFLSNISIIFGGTVVSIFPTVLLLMLVVSNALTVRPVRQFELPKLFSIMIAIIIIGVVRNGDPNETLVTSVHKVFKLLLFTIAFIQVINQGVVDRYSYEKIFIWIVFSPLFFSQVINFFLFAAGYYNAGDGGPGTGMGQMVMLTNMGISVGSSFDFFQGFRGQRSYIGVLLTFSLVGYTAFKSYKKLFLAGAIFSTIVLLVLDTRAALIFPYLILILMFFYYKKSNSPRFIFLLPFLIVFGSSLLLMFTAFLSTIPEFSFLSRSEGDLETGSQRSIIWAIALLEFLQFKIIHLIGYGEFGHYKSGVSSIWSEVFFGWEGSEYKTAHSVMYVILFDYGYAGLIVVVGLLYKSLNRIKEFWNSYRSVNLLFLSFFIYWVLSGITESIFSFYAPVIMYFFIGIIIFVFVVGTNNKETTINK